MLHSWQQFIRKPLVWITSGLAFVFNLITWGILLLNITPQQDLIVLHYTLYFGVDKLGQWKEAFSLPAFGLFLILLNLYFAYYLENKSRHLSTVFLFMSTILQFLIFFSVMFIVLANLPSQI